VHERIEQLTVVGVLTALRTSPRNQSWEAAGLVELIAGSIAGIDQPLAARFARERVAS
jgi:hypothetical protein